MQCVQTKWNDFKVDAFLYVYIGHWELKLTVCRRSFPKVTTTISKCAQEGTSLPASRLTFGLKNTCPLLHFPSSAPAPYIAHILLCRLIRSPLFPALSQVGLLLSLAYFTPLHSENETVCVCRGGVGWGGSDEVNSEQFGVGGKSVKYSLLAWQSED